MLFGLRASVVGVYLALQHYDLFLQLEGNVLVGRTQLVVFPGEGDNGFFHYLEGVILVGHVFPHEVDFRVSPLEPSKGIGVLLEFGVLLHKGFLELIVPDFEPDDFELVVVFVVFEHHPPAELILGVLGLPQVPVLQLLVVVLVHLRLYQPVALELAVHLERLVFALAVYWLGLALWRRIPILFGSAQPQQSSIVVGSHLRVFLAVPNTSRYWKMGLGLGLTVGCGQFHPAGRLEIGEWAGLIVLPAGCFGITLRNGCKVALPLHAFPGHLIHPHFADGLRVEAPGKSDH